MKFLKRTVTILLCALTVFSMTGCINGKKQNDSGKISIVTTVFPLYDFARSIVGDNAEVTMLLPAGAEVHSYEMSPQDIIKIKESDLFINIGGSADPWTEAVINDADKEDVNTLSVFNCVNLLMEEGVEEEHLAHSYDEHVWTSPKNAIKIVDAIYKSICEIDKENIEAYRENSNKLIKNLEDMDRRLLEVVENSKRKKLVFADRFPFLYLAKDYNIEFYAAFPGCSAESEPSAATVTNIIKTVEKEKIPVIFYTETSNQKMADTISEETGAKKMLLHSCHTATKTQIKNGISYVKLMNDNIDALEKALN